MEWGNLPRDLIEEILCRVPAKSLSRFRSTSKQWHALLKSRRFAKKHSACAQKEEPLSLILIDYKLFLVRISLHGFNDNVAPSVKVAYQFNLDESSQVDIHNVFHCDGLLLCTTKDNKLVVWNPCSGETKWVKPRDIYKWDDYYALGYDNKFSRKQYKILRLDRRVILPIKNNYEIYDFTTDSWRVLGVANDWFLSQYGRGVSVKGNSYWIATQAMSSHTNFLLKFDFSTERFQNLSLPQPFPFNISALSVVKDEQLCLLGGFYIEDVLHVWVKTSPESGMSWSKVLTVKAKSEINNNSFSFLADKENEAVVYCNHYTNHNKILHIAGGNKVIQVDPLDLSSTVIPSSYPLLLNYVPSLAQITKGTLLGRRKREEQSM